MRDPARLDNFYDKLKEIHKENFPDWRFSQFMINFLSWYGSDPFYLEENRFLERLEEYVNTLKGD